MRRLTLLLMGLLCAVSANAAVAHVGTDVGSAYLVTPTITTNYTPSGSGNLLKVCMVSYYASGSGGGTYLISNTGPSVTWSTVIPYQNFTNQYNEGQCWSGVVTSSSMIAIVVSTTTPFPSMGGAGDGWYYTITQYSGQATVAPIDAYYQADLVSQANPSTTLTPGFDGEMLDGETSGKYTSLGSGFTASFGNGSANTNIEYQLLGAGTAGFAQTVNFTATAQTIVFQAVSIKPFGSVVGPNIGQAIVSSAGTTCTFGGNVIAGQTVLLYSTAVGSSTTFAASDSRSDTFIKPAYAETLGSRAWQNANASHGNNIGDVEVIEGAVGGYTFFTMTFGSSTTGTCAAIQIAGLAFASPMDPLQSSIAGTNSSAGTAVSIGPITPTPQSVDMVMVAWGTDAAPTVTAGSGYAITQQQQSGTLWSAIEQKAVNAYGAQTGTATLSTSSAWAGLIIPLVESLGPSGTPTLPLITPALALPNTTAYTHKTVCATSCDYTTVAAAVTAATCSEVITVDHTATFTGQIVPPSNSCTPTTRIVVETDDCNAATQLCAHIPAPGVRITPALDPFLPTLQTGNTNPIVATISGGNCNVSSYVWRGLKLQLAHATSPTTDFSAWESGCDTFADTSSGNMLEQVHIASDNSTNVTHGIVASSANLVLADNWVDDIHTVGTDSQAIFLAPCNQAGILVFNNYLEASTENMMAGGSGCGSDYAFTSNVYDVTVQQNYMPKDPCWYTLAVCYVGPHWEVKDSFEFKTCIRCLVTGNVFQYDWNDGQEYMLAMNGIGGSNGGTALVIQDVTFTYNLFQSMDRTFYSANNCSIDSNWDCSTMGSFVARVLFQNNVVDDINQFYNNGDTNPYAIEVAGGPIDVHGYHNTMVTNSYMSSVTLARENSGFGALPNVGSGFNYSNNIITLGQYGYQDSNGGGGGNVGLAFDFPDYVWSNNGIVGTYPPPSSGALFNSSNLNQSTYTGVSFTNYNNGLAGNYQLTSGSPYRNAASDGKDIGVWDWTNFNLLTSLALGGQPQSVAPLGTFFAKGPAQ